MANNSTQRKLTAILSADVKGYSKLMGDDDESTVNTITAYREIIADLINNNQGRVVDTPGDNILAEFGSTLNAVNSAIDIQQALEVENSKLSEKRRMDFRIGINLGDIIHKDDRIYGDGVNVAARIESLADPGGICISRGVFDQVKRKVRNGFEYLGEHTVKNIPEPVRIYRILLAPKFEGKIIGEPVAKPTKIKNRYALVIAVLLICSAVILWIFYPKTSDIEPASIEKMAYPLPDLPSIVVLPLKNLSADLNQDYFCDGLTMDIIAALAKVPDLFVIAWDTTFTFKGKPLNIKQVAEDLGIRYVMHGSVRKAEDKIRINVLLADALKGNHIWTERYDRDLKDTFALQDEITINVLTALQVELTEGEKIRVLTKSTNNLGAYQKWVKGRGHFLRFNIEDNLIGRQLLEEAIDIDPEFTSAYVDLAWTHIMEIYFGISKSPKESLGTASELANKAVRFDVTSPFAQSLLGVIFTMKKQYKEAISQGEKAISLSPSYSLAKAQLGRTLLYYGNYEEALALFKSAIRLDPIPKNWFLTCLGICYLHLGKYEKGVEEFKKVLSRNPKDLTALVRLAMAYSLLEQEENAHATASEIIKLNPKFSVEKVVKAIPYRKEEDRQLVKIALQKAGLPEHPPLKLPDKPSIAVLPFKNMSGDPDQQYFSDGITEQIITSISKVPYIDVIARQSSFAFRDSKETVQQIANKLGVRYILEGSLQRSDDRLRINTQLIDVASGHHIWADHYDREINDIFAVQDEICKNIMVALQVKLTAGEAARLAAETTDIKAYEKFLQGMENYVLRTKESALIARQLFQEAIDLDPRYAIAYVMIGWIHLDDVWLGRTKTPAKSIAKAEAMAQKAISIHSVTTNENALLTGVHVLKKKYDQALDYGEKAVEQCPNCAGAQNLLGVALRYKGRYDEAILRIKKAIRLEPITSIG
jgi:adenylate cyclase